MALYIYMIGHGPWGLEKPNLEATASKFEARILEK